MGMSKADTCKWEGHVYNSNSPTQTITRSRLLNADHLPGKLFLEDVLLEACARCSNHWRPVMEPRNIDPEEQVVECFRGAMKPVLTGKLPEWIAAPRIRWLKFGVEYMTITRTEVLVMIATYSRNKLVSNEVVAWLIDRLNRDSIPHGAVLLFLLGRPTL